MQSKYISFIKDLSNYQNSVLKLKFSSFTCVLGENFHFLDMAVNSIKYLTKKMSSLEVFVIDEDISKKEFINLCNKNSIFSKYSIFIIKNCNLDKIIKLHSIKDINLHNKNIVFAKYLKKITNNILNELNNIKKILAYNINDFDYHHFIYDHSKKLNLNLDKEAVDLLHEYSGNDSANISNFLKTIGLIYCDSKKNIITKEDIKNHTIKLKKEVIFKLNEFLLNSKYIELSYFIKNLIYQGENILAIIYIIFNHFKNSLYIYHYKQKNYNDYEILEMIKLPKRVFENYLQYLSKNSYDKLKKCLDKCYEISIRIKTDNIDNALILDILLFSFTK